MSHPATANKPARGKPTAKRAAKVSIAGVEPDAGPLPVEIHPTAIVGVAPRVQDATDATEIGQRRINLIWERTQSVAAILVLTFFLLVVTFLIVVSPADRQSALLALTGFASIVISTYFTRTNHTKVGGPGSGDTGR